MRHDWDQRYITGEKPWDTGRVDEHLEVMIEGGLLAPGAKALEIGCGTGTNAIWLARRGFDVLALDLSPTALAAAEAKVAEAGAAAIRFARVDFLQEEVPGGPFDFVFDRGCFHVFDEAAEQRDFARRVAALLAPGGRWLSILGSTEGPARDHGPPRRSVLDIAAAIEPVLELVDLRAVEFSADTPTVAAAWRCLSRRRSVPAQPSTRR